MHGPDVLVRNLSRPAVEDKAGNLWQYHSRSDRHSKLACWGILFDLIETCGLLRQHVAKGSVGFGINHQLVDFKSNKKKNLDLVVCTPGTQTRKRPPLTFKGLAERYELVLTDEERSLLDDQPDMRQVPVGSTLIALEAKACMTAHIRALPRLHDELNSSHLIIHGATDHAIAAGFAMVNLSGTFISPDLNKHDLSKLAASVSTHRQPHEAERVIEKLESIPRRTRPGSEGFDALGIVVVDCRNDGSAASLVRERPAPMPNGAFHYESMIRRVAQAYETHFGHV